jgi:hypothetical protein
VRDHDADSLFDRLLLPCLNYLKQDHGNGLVTHEDELSVVTGIRDIMNDIESSSLKLVTANAKKVPEPEKLLTGRRVRILAYPAHDVEDRLALEMFRSVMDEQKWDIEIIGLDALTSDLVNYVEEEVPAVVCIGAVPPGNLAHCRHVCKRLRRQFPDIKIAIGRWAPQSAGNDLDQLQGIGADFIAETLDETRNQLEAWLPVLSHMTAEPAPRQPEPA